jgi:hypothetical protein
VCITPQIERRFHFYPNTDYTSSRTLISLETERLK